MKKTIFIFVGLMAAGGLLSALDVTKRPAGHFGLVAGWPTGLTVDTMVDQSNRFFGDLGVIADDLALQGGWLHEFPGLIKPKDSRLTLKSFLGAAGLFRQEQNDEDRLSVGLALAQELAVSNSPFLMFVRFIPAVRVRPDAGFEMSAVAGMTFVF